MNLGDILRLKFPNASWVKDIILQDDGTGPYIKEWNLEIFKPTKKDLDKWAIELDLEYRQSMAVAARIYPSIGEQLDMQYRDKINDTTIWEDTISAIKAAHPKPTE